ncbi:MAG: DUF3365 domain-containing protein [Gemmatimonadetes bacterium]|nr:DUF3365 domain-containing protein [Gemmatimonadota bacterium]
MRVISHVVMGGLVAGFVVATTPLQAQQNERLAKAVAEMERLDALRSGLAATFEQTGAPADQAAFGQVCKPVGLAMQQGAKEHGWIARQVAVKFRNPANQADAEAVRLMQQFQRDTSLRGMMLRTTMDGRSGIRYVRRITVERSCLACHSEMNKRPEFIKQNYPLDRAFGFRAGELRGLYSVFIPDAGR